MRRILFICIVMQLAFHTLESQIISNKTIIDSASNSLNLMLLSKLNTENTNMLVLSKSDNFPEYFFERSINFLIENKIRVFTNAVPPGIQDYSPLKYTCKNFEINYTQLNSGEFSRSFRFEADILHYDKSGEIKSFLKYGTHFSDTLSSFELQNVEDYSLPITKGKVPPAKRNWYDEILEPAVIITASIVSVVLFFTVRSK